jgi:hypothetical protein
MTTRFLSTDGNTTATIVSTPTFDVERAGEFVFIVSQRDTTTGRIYTKPWTREFDTAAAAAGFLRREDWTPIND